MKWLSKIFLIATVLVSIFFFSKYGRNNDIFYGDALGYYSYLPSAFCLHNLDSIHKFPADKPVVDGIYNYFQMYPNNETATPKGYYVNQYTCGAALFELPFFLVAHAYVRINGLNDNGYSISYHTGVMISTLFYILLGLFFLYRVLRNFFPEDLSLITISIVVLATNLFWFGFLQLGMVHPILFFLVALLLYATIKFYANKTSKWLYLMCFIMGFVALLRPTDIVFGLIPLLYKVESRADLKERFNFLFSFKYKWLLALLVFIIPLAPQLIYWKVYTGSFIYYSYNEQSFDFVRPHLWEGLFGAGNGWLVYTPIWALIIFELISKKRRLFGFRTAILILLPLYIYIIYSWECYQYINGFGSRPMLHIYPLLAIPLASFLNRMSKKKWTGTLAIVPVCFFIYHNLHYSYLGQEKRYDSFITNYPFYFNMMFKNKLSYNDLILKDTEIKQPLESDLKRMKELGSYSYSNDTVYSHVFDPVLGDSAVLLPSGEEFPKINLKASLTDNIENAQKQYVKLSCVVMFPTSVADVFSTVLLVHNLTNGDKNITWNGLKLYTKMGLPEERDQASKDIRLFEGKTKTWDTVTAFFPIPEQEHVNYTKISFWNMPQKAFYLHSVKLEVYQKK